jgi:hypothetical protein
MWTMYVYVCIDTCVSIFFRFYNYISRRLRTTSMRLFCCDLNDWPYRSCKKRGQQHDVFIMWVKFVDAWIKATNKLTLVFQKGISDYRLIRRVHTRHLLLRYLILLSGGSWLVCLFVLRPMTSLLATEARSSWNLLLAAKNRTRYFEIFSKCRRSNAKGTELQLRQTYFIIKSSKPLLQKEAKRM